MHVTHIQPTASWHLPNFTSNTCPLFSCMLCGMPKNTLDNDCKTNRPCITMPYITLPCQTSSSNDLESRTPCITLLHASTLPTFWLDAFATTMYLLNRCPCRMCHHTTPYELLFGHALKYNHLRVFGSLCCPSTVATSPHKLVLRSAPCIFIGCPSETKGYQCYNPTTRHMITSRHIYVDESVLPSSPSHFIGARGPASCTTMQCGDRSSLTDDVSMMNNICQRRPLHRHHPRYPA
jgi:hypothetical protein